MERKVCINCGQPSLEPEPNCWACGGEEFAPEGTPIAGEPTLAGPGFSDATLSWLDPAARSTRRRRSLRLAVGAGIGVFLALAGGLGFWIGRAGELARAASPPASTQGEAVSSSASLPPPPTAEFAPAVGDPAASRPAPPPVTVRPSPSMPLAASTPFRTARLGQFPMQGALVPGPGSGFAPNSGTAPPQSFGPVSAARPAVTHRSAVTPAFPPVTSGPSLPPPAEGRSTVVLRNTTPYAVDVTLGGGSAQEVTLAPGSSVPLQVSSGAYQLRAAARDGNAVSATLGLVSGKSYSISVERRGDGEQAALVLNDRSADSDAIR